MIKYLLHLIVVDIRKKHIPNEKEENYVKDIVFPTLRKLDHEWKGAEENTKKPS